MTTEVDLFLEHYGVKGMKWGIRKDSSRPDKKWAKNIYSVKGAVKVHNRAAQLSNEGLPKLNSKPEYKNAFRVMEKYGEAQARSLADEVAFEKTPAFKQAQKTLDKYYREAAKLHSEATKKAVSEVHGTSPSGEYKAELIFDRFNEPSKIIVKEVKVNHADSQEVEYVFDLEINNGAILSSKLIDETLAQSDISSLDTFLSHYGVKGMKWGVRQAKRKAARRERQIERFRKPGRSESQAKRMATNRKNAQKDMAKAFGGAALIVGAYVGTELAFNDIMMNGGNSAAFRGARFVKNNIRKTTSLSEAKLYYPDAIDVKEVIKTASKSTKYAKAAGTALVRR